MPADHVVERGRTLLRELVGGDVQLLREFCGEPGRKAFATRSDDHSITDHGDHLARFHQGQQVLPGIFIKHCSHR